MLSAIWYHFCNLKNVKNSHGRVLLLVKLQALSCSFTKSKTSPCVFFTLPHCTNGTKSRKGSHARSSIM